MTINSVRSSFKPVALADRPAMWFRKRLRFAPATRLFLLSASFLVTGLLLVSACSVTPDIGNASTINTDQTVPADQSATGFVESADSARSDGEFTSTGLDMAAESSATGGAVDFDMSAGVGSLSVDGSSTTVGGAEMQIPQEPPSEPNRTVTTGSVGAVAATVNDTLSGAVQFEWTHLPLEEGLDGQSYDVKALVPSGWELRSLMGASFEAPETMDFFSDMNFDTGCQGHCEAKDWQAEVMDNPDLSPFAVSSDVEVLVRQDLSNPTGRLLVYRASFGGDPTATVILSRWNDQASRYFVCTVSLHGFDTSLWPGFADACVAAQPTWL